MILNSVSFNLSFNACYAKNVSQAVKKNRQKSCKTLNLNNYHQYIYFKGSLNQENNLPFEISSKLPEGISINELIESSQTKDNLLGIGANSEVYKIPYLNDYVLKILNKDDPNKISINEFPPDVNVGQPVWIDSENPRIMILKKIEGNENSIPNWSKIIWDNDIYAPRPVTKADAQIYFEKLTKIAKMPQQAFDSLAKDIKMISDKNYKLDSINPNNLIVDFDKEQIHVIDFFKVKENERHIYQNCSYDLISLIADFTLLPEYYDKMDEEQKNQTLESVKTAFNKVEHASKKAGLSCDENIFKKYIRTTSRWFCAHSTEKENEDAMYFRYYDVRLEDFLNMLKDPKKWAQTRNA